MIHQVQVQSSKLFNFLKNFNQFLKKNYLFSKFSNLLSKSSKFVMDGVKNLVLKQQV